MEATHELTDGTTTVNLISLGTGMRLMDWSPARPQIGASWRESPLSDGRRLALYKHQNVVDTFLLAAHSHSQDYVIRQMQDLSRLLHKALDYWAATWQDEPVYLVSKAAKETNTRYAIVHAYSWPNDDNPFAQPFTAFFNHALSMEDLSVVVEHGLWQSTAPGEGECTEVFATDLYDGLSLTAYWESLINLDDAYIEDAGGGLGIFYDTNVLRFGRRPFPLNFPYDAGMRFRDILVPPGATITNAYVELQCQAATGAGTNAIIKGQNESAPSAFSTAVDFINRPRTAANVPWNAIPLWIVGNQYQTPNIAAIVQEIIDHSDWVFGNDIVIFIEDNGSAAGVYKTAEALNSGIYNPRLYVAYTGYQYGRERGGVCPDREVYFANKHNDANISHIYHWGAAGWSGNLVGAIPPFPFLPPPVIATGEGVTFGIETATGAGPYLIPSFSSLVFDISTAAVYTGNAVMNWFYSTGGPGWAPLTVRDNTAAAPNHPFSYTGVNSVHWEVPTAWVEQADGPGATTCLWVMCRATVPAPPGDSISVAQQDNRDIYSITWPYMEADGEDIGGDIPAVTSSALENESDTSGAAPDLPTGRMICGLRSASRGTDFTAYMNLSNEQNPAFMAALAVAPGAFANNVAAPTGRMIWWNAGGAAGLTQLATITITDGISVQYYGTFRAFLRIYPQDAVAHTLQLHTQVGVGADVLSAVVAPPAVAHVMAIDMGMVNIPGPTALKFSEHSNSIVFTIYASCAAASILYFYDLILIPVDEWSGDFEDTGQQTNLTQGRYLLVDSVLHPKAQIRSLARDTVNDNVLSVWRPIANGEAMLQANADQKMWHLVMYYDGVSGVEIVARPDICHSVEVERTQKYLSMRGDR